MFLGKKKRIEDSVVELLGGGPLVITDLVVQLQQRIPRTTKQGVYAAVRALKSQQVIVTHHGTASLNVDWLNKVNTYAAIARQKYVATAAQSGHFANLQDGEKIQYSFQSPAATDIFWNHALHILAQTVFPGEPFVAYNPHCWFFLAHRDNERALRDGVLKSGRQYLVTASARSPLDRSIAAEFDGEHSQYHMRSTPLFEKQNYYVNIIGDYLIEVWLDEKTATAIEELYASTAESSADARIKLETIIEQRGKTRLIISRNSKKAEKIKKKLLKYFYLVPKVTA